MKAYEDIGVYQIPCIPTDVISSHEKQAWKNHGQTLGRLAERGGLSASEAVAVIRDQHYPTAELDSCNKSHDTRLGFQRKYRTELLIECQKMGFKYHPDIEKWEQLETQTV